MGARKMNESITIIKKIETRLDRVEESLNRLSSELYKLVRRFDREQADTWRYISELKPKK